MPTPETQQFLENLLKQDPKLRARNNRFGTAFQFVVWCGCLPYMQKELLIESIL